MVKLNSDERKRRNDALFIPLIATAVAAALLILAVFLPYITADKELENLAEDFADMFGKVEDFDAKDYLSFSMFKMYRTLNSISESGFESFFYAVMFLSPMVIAIVILALILLKKPLGIMILDGVALLFYLIPFFVVKKATKMSGYEWGFGFYFHFFVFAAILICAVWLWISKTSFEKGLEASKPMPKEDKNKDDDED